MELPPISHRRRDPRTGVVYDVRAYRQMSDEEVTRQIILQMGEAKFRRAKKSGRAKKPRRGETVVIITNYGLAPSL